METKKRSATMMHADQLLGRRPHEKQPQHRRRSLSVMRNKLPQKDGAAYPRIAARDADIKNSLASATACEQKWDPMNQARRLEVALLAAATAEVATALL